MIKFADFYCCIGETASKYDKYSRKWTELNKKNIPNGFRVKLFKTTSKPPNQYQQIMGPLNIFFTYNCLICFSILLLLVQKSGEPVGR